MKFQRNKENIHLICHDEKKELIFSQNGELLNSDIKLDNVTVDERLFIHDILKMNVLSRKTLFNLIIV